jgi:hypothetical protein
MFSVILTILGFTASYQSLQLNVTSSPSLIVSSVNGWIVVHNRPFESTYNYAAVDWNMATSGFGSTDNDSDFWLGLERMYQMTSSNPYRLRFELQQTSSGSWYSAEYWWFAIGDGTVSKYRIQLAGLVRRL